MQFIDWIFVALPLLLVAAAGIYAQSHVRSVADFMSANRMAGRYLLCIAGNELQAGAVVFVALFEVFSQSGFVLAWWGTIGVLVNYLVRATGFVIYRYRETRAMTLGQFFEIRYGKSLRLFAGLLGFFAGILNFGIIPAIGARCLVYFLGLPETVRILSLTVPTYVPLMALFLTITCFVAISGGVITVMIINTLEGIISQIFYVIIIIALLLIFTWPEMHSYLLDRKPGYSLVNPFDAAKVADFNLSYVLMGLAAWLYGTMAWQNASAYNSAGRTPHEGRMAAVLGTWRDMGKGAVITMLALCALTYLHDPKFAAGAAEVHHAVGLIADKQAQEQMQVPVALAHLLPVGIRGMLCVVLLMGIFGGDATHLHSWGGILIQDFLVPLRKKPFGPKAHLFALRCSIFGVAFFAFLFGAFFHMNDYINMWWSITQSVYVAGAGSAIIGGLYWKRGTTTAAWTAFILGPILSLGGVVMEEVYAAHGGKFFLNGVQVAFFSTLITGSVYVIVSLLTSREEFNLARMLHRGAYAVIKQEVGDNAPVEHRQVGFWGRIIGFDGNYTVGDKWIAGTLFAWGFCWLGVTIIGTIWNLAAPWSAETWVSFYHVTGIGLPIVFAVVMSIWLTWGGVIDMAALFRRLGREKVNVLDDGTVVNNQNLDEVVAEERHVGH
jgi:SSS family solute:Na+ symporter